jgi:general stress protein 26
MPLTSGEIDEFLRSPRLAHFATIGSDGRPRVRPIWFVWSDGALWLTTRLKARTTGADLTAGSAAAVSIASEDHPYRAFLARGTPVVWATDRDQWLDRIARRYDALGWLEGALTEPDRVVLRLVPDEVITWDYGRGDYDALNSGKSLRTTL